VASEPVELPVSERGPVIKRYVRQVPGRAEAPGSQAGHMKHSEL